MLDGVGEGLGDHVVRGRLGFCGHAVVRVQVQPDRERGALGQHVQRAAEPGLDQDGRVHATGQVTDLVERLGQDIR
jgi:hypothetical protein